MDVSRRRANEPWLRRGRERAAVDALDEALGGELAQVAPDGVLGDAELLDEARGDDLPVARERVEDRLAALGAEQGGAARSCTIVHGTAWLCRGQSKMRMTATTVPPTITTRRSHCSGSLRP